MPLTLATLAVLASTITGQPCAAIDNKANAAAWKVPGQRVVTTTYSDNGDRLVYRPAPGPRNNRAWLALHTAEATLTIGQPGPKLRVACG
jgi:hypothetical protein